MPLSTILFAIAGLATLTYVAGRQRAILVCSREPAQKFHSLPGYHGAYVAFWCVLPLLLVFVAWMVFEPSFLRASVLAALPAEFATASADVTDARNLLLLEPAGRRLDASVNRLYGFKCVPSRMPKARMSSEPIRSSPFTSKYHR